MSIPTRNVATRNGTTQKRALVFSPKEFDITGLAGTHHIMARLTSEITEGMQFPRRPAGRVSPVLLACFLLINFFSGSQAIAQSTASPFYETRAVWLATVLGDGNWPDINDSASQQAEALRELIRQAHRLGINTFFMQVVARGDAMYPSALLPWSARLKGPGENPGYDPLQVAITEAHLLGMELHAWVNVYRIGDTSTLAEFANVTNPRHIGFEQPGWVAEVGSQVWLDPSVEGAKAWLVDVVSEIVTNYDVDGIHYDFIRYPEGGFESDGPNFQFDDRGYADLPDWRRGHINAFVEMAYDAVTAIKPWVKIGAAPLGNYRETDAWPAFWAYSDAYQESRLWLQNGWHDYLAPQIYFSRGTSPEGSNSWPSPDFTVLVNEWVAESAGRPIIAGYAAYKPSEGSFSAADLPLQIDDARAAGAAGQAAFRYDHMMEYANLIGSRYEQPAVPVPMLHRFEARAPSTPSGLTLTAQASGANQLDWSASAGNAQDPTWGYVIMRRENSPPSEENAADLLAVVAGGATSYIDDSADPQGIYYYSVAARSALGVLSPMSASVSNQAVTALERPGRDNRTTTIVSVFPNPASETATVTYYLANPTYIDIKLHDAIGRQTSSIESGQRQPGLYSTEIDIRTLARGVYQVVMRTEEGLSSWPMIVSR